MPIQVECSACSGKFRVPDNVAGKKIRCPKCQNVIPVPAAEEPSPFNFVKPDAAAPAAPKPAPTPVAAKPAAPKPVAASPKPAPAPKSAAPAPAAVKPADAQWWMKTEDGEEYGPVPRAEIDSWHAEGRISADCKLRRDDSPQWQPAAAVYPDLAPAPAAAPVQPPAPPKAAPIAAKAAPKPAPTPAPSPTPAPAKPIAAAAKPTAASPTPAALASKPATAAAPAPAAPIADDKPAFSIGASAPHGHGGGGFDPSAFAFLGGGHSEPAGDAEPSPFSFGAPASGGDEGGGFSFTPSPAAGGAGPAPIMPAATPKPAAKAIVKGAKAPIEPGAVSDKSKTVAIVLCILLGSLGVHRFYLGYTLLGIAQLCTCGGCGVWQVIDVIFIIRDQIPDSQGRALKK